MKKWQALLALTILAFATINCIPKGDQPAGSAPAAPAASAPAAASPTKVTLRWDQPVDMDLEIWNASGQNLIHRAFAGENWTAPNCGTDVTDGTKGEEFFIFKSAGSEDFATGEYVVSIYFAQRPEGSNVTSARATVVVTKADGSTVERSRNVQWEEGQDQWHAFRIDAKTGNILEDIDKFIKIETTQNN